MITTLSSTMMQISSLAAFIPLTAEKVRIECARKSGIWTGRLLRTVKNCPALVDNAIQSGLRRDEHHGLFKQVTLNRGRPMAPRVRPRETVVSRGRIGPHRALCSYSRQGRCPVSTLSGLISPVNVFGR